MWLYWLLEYWNIDVSFVKTHSFKISWMPTSDPGHPTPLPEPSDFFYDPAAKGLMSGPESNPRDQTLSDGYSIWLASADCWQFEYHPCPEV